MVNKSRLKESEEYLKVDKLSFLNEIVADFEFLRIYALNNLEPKGTKKKHYLMGNSYFKDFSLKIF